MTENERALTLRREWMNLIGCDQIEIDEACSAGVEANVREEQENVDAANRLAEMKLQAHVRYLQTNVPLTSADRLIYRCGTNEKPNERT